VLQVREPILNSNQSRWGHSNAINYMRQSRVFAFCVAPPPDQTWIKERFGAEILCQPRPGTSFVSTPDASRADSTNAKRPELNNKPVELMTITLRSTRDVFRFVGQVITAQTETTRPLR